MRRERRKILKITVSMVIVCNPAENNFIKGTGNNQKINKNERILEIDGPSKYKTCRINGYY